MESRKQRREERKQLYINLLGGVCVNCCTEENLQFDHVLPEEKHFSISIHLSDMSVERILPELQKCQLLCTDCHKYKTREDRRTRLGIEIKHGTLNAYHNRGCRCELCRDAAAYFRKLKKGIVL